MMATAATGMEPSMFIGPVDKSLICTLCSNVMTEPRSCREGHAHCEACFKKYLKNHKTCPDCRTKVSLKTLSRVLPVDNMIQRLEVKCTNCDNPGQDESDRKKGSAPSGCEWTGPLSARESHLKECALEQVECRWKCGTFQRRHLAEHEGECLDRVLSCEHCGAEVMFREMKRHLQQCGMAPTMCPNGCGVSTRKAMLPQHDAQCVLKVIACPFARHGCGKHVMRKDMPDHVTADAGAHTLLLSSALLSSAEKARADIEAKDTTIARLEKSLAEKDESLRRLVSRLNGVDATTAQLRADIKNVKSNVQGSLNELAADSEKAKADLSKKSLAISRLEKSLADKDATLSQLTSCLTEMVSSSSSVSAEIDKLKNTTRATVKWDINDASRVFRARDHVCSDSFLVGDVPGWGVYFFSIEFEMDKTTSDVGLFLTHDRKMSGDYGFPLDITGSSISVLHGEKEVFSRTMTGHGHGGKIDRPGRGLGWPKAFVYQELLSMLSAKDSCNKLRIIAQVVLPHRIPILEAVV